MDHMPFYIVDVFAEEKYEGNPLAVIRNAARLSEQAMQQIANEMNYSETTFILSDDKRDGGYDVRIFTPDRELPFAGHPTLGTAYVIRHEIRDTEKHHILLNYRIGQIKVTHDRHSGSTFWMKQKTAEFGRTYAPDAIADVLALEPSDFDDRFPIQEVSTGAPAIIAPLDTLESVKTVKPDYEKLASLPKDPATIGILTFCSQPENAENHLHDRFFTMMKSVPEDPATGSANGCLAGYLAKWRYFGEDAIDARVEQGYEIGRPSLLHLKAVTGADGIAVDVGGKVVKVADGFLR